MNHIDWSKIKYPITLEYLMKYFKSEKVFTSIDFDKVGVEDILPCDKRHLEPFDFFHLFKQRWYQYKKYKRYNADTHNEYEHKVNLPPHEFNEWMEKVHKPYLKKKRAEKARRKREALEVEAIGLLVNESEGLFDNSEAYKSASGYVKTLDERKLKYVIRREKNKLSKKTAEKERQKNRMANSHKKDNANFLSAKQAFSKLKKLRRKSSLMIKSESMFQDWSDLEIVYNWAIKMTYSSGLIVAGKIRRIAESKDKAEYIELANRIEKHFKKWKK